ncbi:hypothetical protein DFJ77DRAFT_352075 [Powellomyces hirtus]|nr:hypothetical protein DFJ77DRAFT_352075 [Powellomyces hirtus]
MFPPPDDDPPCRVPTFTPQSLSRRPPLDQDLSDLFDSPDDDDCFSLLGSSATYPKRAAPPPCHTMGVVGRDAAMADCAATPTQESEDVRSDAADAPPKRKLLGRRDRSAFQMAGTQNPFAAHGAPSQTCVRDDDGESSSTLRLSVNSGKPPASISRTFGVPAGIFATARVSETTAVDDAEHWDGDDNMQIGAVLEGEADLEAASASHAADFKRLREHECELPTGVVFPTINGDAKRARTEPRPLWLRKHADEDACALESLVERRDACGEQRAVRMGSPSISVTSSAPDDALELLPGPTGTLPPVSAEEEELMFGGGTHASLLLPDVRSTRPRHASLSSHVHGSLHQQHPQQRQDPHQSTTVCDTLLPLDAFPAWRNMAAAFPIHNANTSIASCMSGPSTPTTPTTLRIEPPFVVLIDTLLRTDVDAAAELRDAAGERVRAVIHDEVLKLFGDGVEEGADGDGDGGQVGIGPGAVLQLRNVSILNIGRRAKYLNITTASIMCVYLRNGDMRRQ